MFYLNNKFRLVYSQKTLYKNSKSPGFQRILCIYICVYKRNPANSAIITQIIFLFILLLIKILY